jgi:hypothetical protein
VVLENTTSDKIHVTSWVPQGTVQGPILFLIYINDLPEYFKHSNIRLFADDSIIYRKIQSQKDCLDLQDDLEAAAIWEEDWLMAFHADKCNLLSITTKRRPEHFYYNLHDHILESVASAKYLGITLQSNLGSDDRHIERLSFVLFQVCNCSLQCIDPKLKSSTPAWDELELDMHGFLLNWSQL